MAGDGRFVNGTSGNPGGKPRSAHLRELCRTYTEAAVKELGRLALKAKTESTRIRAIAELLDRGYGRPMQALEVALDDNRPGQEESRQLTAPEVMVALGEILTKAEAEMGIAPDSGLTNEQRVERML
jgi:hypothetical protein